MYNRYHIVVSWFLGGQISTMKGLIYASEKLTA